MTDDNPRQGRIARDALERAEMVALTSPTLCELAWVLSRGYKIPAGEIAEAFRRLIDAANVVVNRPAAEAGLAHLEAGGDFADGVIAFEGADLGADTFVSFDKSAVKLALAQGMNAKLLA
jgi:predicted nucleic-acid-binding protein